MPNTAHNLPASAGHQTNSLLRGILLSLFAAGTLAICLLWLFEAHYALLDASCRIIYPTMIVILTASAAMLYRWPGTVVVARWIAFLATSVLLYVQYMPALWGGPLVGDYAFISALMWLPLPYAMALLMLETRHALLAVSTLFALVAASSIERLAGSYSVASTDTALIVNLLTSHIVLLACLSGLMKFKEALFKADADSQRLVEQASTDPLTGLANRRHGMERLRHALRHHRTDRPSAVLLCDIDYFKEINDHFGHDAGDRVIRHVASVLRANTRSADTVIRWGGDEFLVVVPDIGEAALRDFAERLRTHTAQALALDDDGSVTPYLSIGVATALAAEAPADWVRRADAALYQAKAAGRNRWVLAGDQSAGASPAAMSPGALADPALRFELATSSSPGA